MLVENWKTCELVVKIFFDEEKYNIIIQRQIQKLLYAKMI